MLSDFDIVIELCRSKICTSRLLIKNSEAVYHFILKHVISYF